MRIFGIDPGIAGAIAILDEKKIIDVIDLPTMADGKKNKKQLNSAHLSQYISDNIIDLNKTVVVVEQVNAMPGQGVTSMFNFGQTFGAIKGISATLKIPIFFARPSKWKKHFELINSSKDASRTKVIEMYPYLLKNCRKKVNKSDAILIARFLVKLALKMTKIRLRFNL